MQGLLWGAMSVAIWGGDAGTGRIRPVGAGRIRVSGFLCWF